MSELDVLAVELGRVPIVECLARVEFCVTETGCIAAGPPSLHSVDLSSRFAMSLFRRCQPILFLVPQSLQVGFPFTC
jgi:hypothetical protein